MSGCPISRKRCYVTLEWPPKLHRLNDYTHKEVDKPLLKNMLSDAERARGLTGEESGVVNGDIPWTRDVPTRNLTGEG